MFKNSILVSAITVTVFAVSCGAAQASALKVLGSPMEQWQRNNASQSASPAPSSALRSDCPKLAGKWVGKCTNQTDTEYDGELEIEQTNCQKMKLGGKEIQFGGINSMPHENGEYRHIFVAMPDWNAGLTGFDVRINFMGRLLNQPFYASGNGSESYELVGNTLLVRSKWVSTSESSGQTSQVNSHHRCEYTLAN
jgi:hypothetical protein